MFLGQIDSGIADGPINNFIELCVALNTGDLNLVLQSKVAIVDNTELRQLVCTARLPKNLVCGSIVFGLESKGLTLCTFPICAVGGHFKIHIQITRLNLVHASGCAVCKPGEGGSHQHGNAEYQRCGADQQTASGGISVCLHLYIPP